ncbi:MULTISPECIES: aldo/keto reductase [unclassified Leeuwenhoekiella]|uniref:aldo/keto reductase n=1 Tax=unclassified Leeuwenhoekiella TaxID=2615029 RepID=UPI000C4B966A|nr:MULTISPECIES: aldo/keto reductase [unclassified Leeuwenhoekiella]MAW96604.1 aldo/keto reductase [Leeuwenhoekiella sp.]MBA81492.1 aldo/keto reductase [Leeuwenhoekiella sp.]|tara:strand:- start:19856 stop:20710 length:855 start_codon:yes stop_codon:yes gene_type:complete
MNTETTIKSITNLQGTWELRNGYKMPYLGLGVWKAEDGEEVINAVKWAIEAGYRHIDTAKAYDNEEGVGKGIKDSGVAREELFITSKLWNNDQGYESTLKAFDKTLQRLDTDYLDLYLIHWPVEGKYKNTWRAMEKLYKEGKIKAIGVSNFLEHHLMDLMKDCEVKPMVDQLEFHPWLVQEDLQKFCAENDIQYEAWSPLMQGKAFENETLKEIGEKYGKTPAQVVLRWDLQNGVITIPKSTSKDHIKSNANVFDFELSEEDMQTITNLDKGRRIGPDPDNFDF